MLHTSRLILRPFTLTDAPEVHCLLSTPEIAATTLRIPYPYEEGFAQAWIVQHPASFEQGKGVVFAMERQEDGRLVGCVSLECDTQNCRAELGYWVGVPYWNHGYATEAARMVIGFGFAHFTLNRIQGRHFASNPASGRVMEKAGLLYEGRLRNHIYKKGRGFEDVLFYGILSADFAAAR